MLCSLLKTVFNWLGDTYQAYSNTYKMHPMDTHHGGTGLPLDRNATLNGKDTDANIPHNYHHEGMDNFENVEQENHTNLATLTWELDDLHHRVQAREDQLIKALYHIECKLQKLAIALCPSVPLEPLDNVLQQ